MLVEEVPVDCLYRFFRFSVVVALVVVVAGCPESGPKTVPAEGTLTIDGQPGNNISISFVPTDPDLVTASGNVENGKFTMYTGNQGKPGVMPGKYKVVLTPAASDDESRYKPSADGGGSDSAPKEAPLPFPAKYMDPGTSDIEVEVTDGSKPIEIKIQSEGAADSGDSAGDSN